MDWANQNEGFIALLTFVLVSILVPLLRGPFKRLSEQLSHATSETEIRRTEALRAEFYTNLKHIDQSRGYGPFLIRDVARDQLYFNGDDAEFSRKAPPPSFQVQVVDMSVFGVRVYHGLPERIKKIENDSTWCLASEGDEYAVMVHPIGIIPFSMIVAVNWHGDPANTFPHIFCRFDGARGWPYKKFEYCECAEIREGRDYYSPLLDADALLRRKF